MYLSYYGYYLTDVPKDKRYLVDLRHLVENFVKKGDSRIKSSITWYGDHLYLLPFAKNTYLFVQSRDREIIKAIESKTFSVDDIQNKLSGESVGFGSYVYMDEHHLGLAAKILSPRIQAFSSYMTQIIHAAGGSRFQFTPRALTTSISKAAAHKFKHVGAVTVEMSTTNSVGIDLLRQVLGNAQPDLANVGSIELTIKPVRKGGKSLGKELVQMTQHIPDNGLESIEIRGKMEMAERVSDYYIVSEGGLRDFVLYRRESDLYTLIPNTAALPNNKKVQVKVAELKNDGTLKKGKSLSDLGIDRNLVTTAPTVARKSVGTKSRAPGKRVNRRTGT